MYIAHRILGVFWLTNEKRTFFHGLLKCYCTDSSLNGRLLIEGIGTFVVLGNQTSDKIILQLLPVKEKGEPNTMEIYVQLDKVIGTAKWVGYISLEIMHQMLEYPYAKALAYLY